MVAPCDCLISSPDFASRSLRPPSNFAQAGATADAFNGKRLAELVRGVPCGNRQSAAGTRRCPRLLGALEELSCEAIRI
jgi:hypothetical protein